MNLDSLKQSDTLLDTELNYLKAQFMNGWLSNEAYESHVFSALERYNTRIRKIYNNN